MVIIRWQWLVLLFASFWPWVVNAHTDTERSVHDVIAEVQQRLRVTLAAEKDLKLTHDKLLDYLTTPEKQVLAQEHIRFHVNQPSRIMIIRDSGLPNDPFWLSDRGFTKSDAGFAEAGLKLEAWETTVDPGEVRLGVNGFGAAAIHYLIAVEALESSKSKAADGAEALEITDLYPKSLRVTQVTGPLQPYVDHPHIIEQIPSFLQGKQFIRTHYNRKNDAQLLNLFRQTKHVATAKPDQITLTWQDNPATSQTIQWRASPEITTGWVKFQEKALLNQFQPAPYQTQAAVLTPLTTVNTVNDPLNNRFTAHLTELKPDTEYLYSVGAGDAVGPEGWSELARFKTAPVKTQPFSFVYLGDAQNGLYRWGSLINRAHRHRPDAAFYLMAGDLVDRGNDRDEWDDFFYNARGIFNEKTLVPVIGNHEVQGGHPTLYLALFALLENGPDNVTPERAYSFEYSNAQFIILDTTLALSTQTQWLQQTLADSDATWKFVAYHHPAYPSSKRQPNPEFAQSWLKLFDQYQVDFALQGHDHAYLRTYPMKNQIPVISPEQAIAHPGTIYLVSVSGTKMYPQKAYDYTAKGFENISTYQLFDIDIDGDRLHYRAYDFDGILQDSVVIEK